MTDRMAVVNMIIGLDGYTFGTGIYIPHLHGEAITAIPLEADEHIEVGLVTHKDYVPSKLGAMYIEAMETIAAEFDQPRPESR